MSETCLKLGHLLSWVKQGRMRDASTTFLCKKMREILREKMTQFTRISRRRIIGPGLQIFFYYDPTDQYLALVLARAFSRRISTT